MTRANVVFRGESSLDFDTNVRDANKRTKNERNTRFFFFFLTKVKTTKEEIVRIAVPNFQTNNNIASDLYTRPFTFSERKRSRERRRSAPFSALLKFRRKMDLARAGVFRFRRNFSFLPRTSPEREYDRASCLPLLPSTYNARINAVNTETYSRRVTFRDIPRLRPLRERRSSETGGGEEGGSAAIQSDPSWIDRDHPPFVTIPRFVLLSFSLALKEIQTRWRSTSKLALVNAPR